MTCRTLLVGPRGHGGEGVYMERLREHPPEGVAYLSAGDFHQSAPGAPCQVAREVLLNQVVHRLAIPDMGFRALRLRARLDLVHVHAHPVVLAGLGSTPLVMSESSSAAVYLGDYLGWDDARLARGFARSRALYRRLGIADRLLALEPATLVYVWSQWAREPNLRWGADPGKLRVLRPGVPDPGPVVRPERETFTFLFVGRDFARKGGFEVLAALDALRREQPHVRLVLAGSDPYERDPDPLARPWVSEARRARGLVLLAGLERDSVVQRIAWIGQDALRDVYAAADAVVMPTHAEGFGLTNVEALSHALPVITSTAGPAAEIVDDGATGLLVAAGDTAARKRSTVKRFRAGLRAIYDEALAA